MEPAMELWARATADINKGMGVDDTLAIVAGGSFYADDLETVAEFTRPQLIPDRKGTSLTRGLTGIEGTAVQEPTAEELLRELHAENRQLKAELQNARTTIERLCDEVMEEKDRREVMEAQLEDARDATYTAKAHNRSLRQQNEELQSRLEQLRTHPPSTLEGDGADVILPLKMMRPKSSTGDKGLKDLAVEIALSATELSLGYGAPRPQSPPARPLCPLLARLEVEFSDQPTSASPPSESGTSVADSCTSIPGGGCAAGAAAEPPQALADAPSLCRGCPNIALHVDAVIAAGSAPAALLAADAALEQTHRADGVGPVQIGSRGNEQNMAEERINTLCAAAGSAPASLQLAAQDCEDYVVASLGQHVPALGGASPSADSILGSSSSAGNSFSHGSLRPVRVLGDTPPLTFPQLAALAQSPMALSTDPVPHALGMLPAPAIVSSSQSAAPAMPVRTLTPRKLSHLASCSPTVTSPTRLASTTVKDAWPAASSGQSSPRQTTAADWRRGDSIKEELQCAAVTGTELPSAEVTRAIPVPRPQQPSRVALDMGLLQPSMLHGSLPSMPGVVSPVFPGIDNVRTLHHQPMACSGLTAALSAAMDDNLTAHAASSQATALCRSSSGVPDIDSGMLHMDNPAHHLPGVLAASTGNRWSHPGSWASESSKEVGEPSRGANQSNAIPICRKSHSLPREQPLQRCLSQGAQQGPFRIDRIDVAPSVQTLPCFPPQHHLAPFSLPTLSDQGFNRVAMPRPPSKAGGVSSAGYADGGQGVHIWDGEDVGEDC